MVYQSDFVIHHRLCVWAAVSREAGGQAVQRQIIPLSSPQVYAGVVYQRRGECFDAAALLQFVPLFPEFQQHFLHGIFGILLVFGQLAGIVQQLWPECENVYFEFFEFHFTIIRRTSGENVTWEQTFLCKKRVAPGGGNSFLDILVCKIRCLQITS